MPFFETNDNETKVADAIAALFEALTELVKEATSQLREDR